ncbi:MAG: M14 family zinc carboxypeptidase [Candidatus Cloacimonetes bacterium]|nr:M14 family zinc carboxypeptidase [Candidatus Cloacimonadota bacterium]MDD4559827.1 M14 family zinc carboxypeptidase [Candidatus Cloacimonadota bacterium]
MRLRLICLLMAFIPLILFAQVNLPLPECYHTYEEATSELFALEDQYPTMAKVHIIGYSEHDSIPIYALQISNDVQQLEGSWNRPALLFVGQVHAEEVLGVQITLSNAKEILQNNQSSPYIKWINQLDTWWVPTLNPEGHNVVTANMDTSYRKNKRDNNNNGILDFDTRVGYDIDGVDINRNFDFNWAHGDTLMQPGGDEVYDYYRGPAPMSESENQAIKALCDQKKFVYSICWHSSRSGNFSEKVYFSYNWKDVRPSPDFAFAQSIAQGVATAIHKENGQPYEYYPNASRRGAFHDWMYKEYGTIQLLIEVGTSNLQPEEPMMLDTVDRASEGVWWMLNRALNYSTDVPSTSMLTGTVIDSVTGEALEAEIIIPEKHAPWFVPRTSSPDTGRFWKVLPQGNYTIQARKKGYWDTVITNVTVYNTGRTTRNPELSPKQSAQLHGYVSSNGMNIPARIIIKDFIPDELNIVGAYQYEGFEGTYPIEIWNNGYYPYLENLAIAPGASQISFELGEANIIFSETWEQGTDNWEINGPWLLQDELSVNGNAITDSWGGRGHYARNCDVWIATKTPIDIPLTGNPLLHFDSHVYTEWNFDPVTVEVSTDGSSWQEIWIKSGRHDWWQKEYAYLSDFAGQRIYLRFRLRDVGIADELTDPGWTIDNIYIVSGSSSAHKDVLVPGLEKNALYQNYPNPAKNRTYIPYSLTDASEVHIDIYNIRGQLVRSYRPGNKAEGSYTWLYDGKDDDGKTLASGIYLYRMKAGKYNKTRRMVWVK